MARVQLSSQLSDQTHTRPVVESLRKLADQSNTLDTLIGLLRTKVDGIRVPTIAEIAKALQASGSTPLNITALVPGTGTSGTGTLSFGTHGDRLALPTSGLKAGTGYVETDRLALYLWTGFGWLLVVNNYALGDVIANLPADLTAGDTGYLFFATDFDRLYEWTGSAWQDAAGQPSREQVVFFNTTTVPVGWALCDGATVTISLPDGTVDATYVTPDLLSTNAFVRANATPGGTGGSATAVTSAPSNPDSGGPSPSATDINSAAQIVQSGVGVTVAASPHTHDMNAHLHTIDHTHTVDTVPPYFDLVPLIRL